MADRRRRPPRYNAVVASAAVMNQRPEGLRRMTSNESWQNDAWDYYDEVGELRFAIGWVANGLSRVNLVAAIRPDNLGDEPTLIRPEDPDGAPLADIDKTASDLVSNIAGGPDGQSQMLARLAVLLSVPGVGWVLVENPPDDELVQLTAKPVGTLPLPTVGEQIINRERYVSEEPSPKPQPDWAWRVLSNEELREQSNILEVLGENGDWRPLAEEHVLIKVWRSHPRRADQPDSPCRATRRVCRRIMLLDDHIDATAQSRLAGAGVLVLPTEVEFKPIITTTDVDAVDGEPVEDDFADVLVETMTVPIGDRGSAAAVVPLVVKIPGEYVDKVRHITFWSDFSDQVDELQDRAIKRLALGMDMPPEIVTGVSGMNHWGAWQVEEQAVSLHIEPLAEIITHAITIGYFRPALLAYGYAAEDVAKRMVSSDTTDLTTRPDRSDDSIAAYDRIELSGEALRRESGLSESDKPSDEERRARLLLRALDRSPMLADQLLPLMGVEAFFRQPGSEPAAMQLPAIDQPATPPITDLGPPAEADSDFPDLEQPMVAAMFVEACDGLVHRALERAGGRLRRAAGRGVNGGAGTVDCPDPTLLHTRFDATSFASLGELTQEVWEPRATSVADRFGVDGDSLVASLDRYVKQLLTEGEPHDRNRMSSALREGVVLCRT